MNIHPAVRILLLVTFALMIQLLGRGDVILVALMMLCLLLWRGMRKFLNLLKRGKWLFLSLILIYAMSTPGELVPFFPDLISPTYEGVESGLLQVGRLGCMLAALALLLSTTSREKMISGIFYLLNPFNRLGLKASTFAARLWLTLHYIENMPPRLVQELQKSHWNIAHHVKNDAETEMIYLDCPALTIWDGCLMALIPVLMLMLI